MQDDNKLDLITAVVERGEADKAVKAALEAGAHGATILIGRGTGVRQRLGVLGLMIQPEKEIILIVAHREVTNVVFDALIEAAKLEEPARGFAYVQEVARATGFVGGL